LADKPENSGVYVATFAKPAERVFLFSTEMPAAFAPSDNGTVTSQSTECSYVQAGSSWTIAIL